MKDDSFDIQPDVRDQGTGQAGLDVDVHHEVAVVVQCSSCVQVH